MVDAEAEAREQYTSPRAPPYWLVTLPDGGTVEVSSWEEAEAMIEEADTLGYSAFSVGGKDGWEPWIVLRLEREYR